jgi:phage gp36-like protein
MQNGHDKSISINPMQAAAYALEFMARAPHTHPERERYDIAYQMLTAIMQGQVQLAQAPQTGAPAEAAMTQ